jgi:anti-sigma B factor antagonist
MATFPTDLRVDLQPTRSGYAMTLFGELDIATAPILADRVDDMRPEDGGELTLDLTGLTFCDSAGVTALVRLRQWCERVGWTIQTINVGPTVRRILVDFTGLGGYLNVRPS